MRHHTEDRVVKMPVSLLDKAEAEYRKTPEEIKAIRRDNATKSAVELDGPVRAERRRAMISVTAREDVADAFERYVGDNDLLPINYLLLGYQRGRAVGRVRYFDKREGKPAVATGFLISPQLMITNHHVFPAQDLASFRQLFDDATVDFGFEFDPDGNRAEPVVYDLDPDIFFHANQDLDLALVAVKSSDRNGRHQLNEQGYLVLNHLLGKAGMGDCATIIQYPEGREKQIALRANEIINLDLPKVIIYASDTAQGSSGAPVFNNEWQVIAMHSAGVAKKNANDEYVDQFDQVIEPVNGKIDGSRVVWVSNRGIRASSIMEYLRIADTPVSMHPLVQALFLPAYNDSRLFSPAARDVVPMERTLERVPALPAPAPATATLAPVSIQITIGATGVQVEGLRRDLPQTIALTGALEAEKKFEDEMDFTGCDGFVEDFMGERIAMPVPSATLRRKLAHRIDSPSSYTLKYRHFSTLHHAVRRVPVVSAINVHGKYRYSELGKDSRADKWFRDNRLDYDVQLDDEWYARSGFDRGHLARREDAEWGYSMGAAKLAADMTCSYANAAPQVPALNRAIFGYHGLWGTLEGKLLEAGVENESGKSARVCVFSGPLFDDDDPVFKGVQVALSFYKVVVWYDAGGALRTTCFRLSQEQLVGEIEFEALHFDDVFKTYQCPLTDIEKVTGLTFSSRLRDTDTSSGAASLLDAGSLERLLQSDRKPSPVPA